MTLTEKNIAEIKQGNVDALKSCTWFDFRQVIRYVMPHIHMVKHLMEEWDLTDSQRNFALRIGVNSKMIDVVRYLLTLGIKVSEDNVHDAVYNGDLEMVKLLVENGGDVHFTNDFVLRVAAENGYVDVVKYLVEKQGCDFRFMSDHAFRAAAENGHLEVVKYLVDRGADVHAYKDYAIRFASEFGHSEVVEYLKERGCILN